MRQGLPRIPKDRIAVLIGSKGTTAKSLRNASGAKEFHIDSETGDVEVVWGELLDDIWQLHVLHLKMGGKVTNSGKLKNILEQNWC